MASVISRVCQAVASRTARAMCALVTYRVRPAITPRASERQYGANRPEKAGTKYAPPLSSTDERERLDLGGGGDQAHLVAHPLHQRTGDGDRALQGVDRLSGRRCGSRPWSAGPLYELTGLSPVFISRKVPVPYVDLASPSEKQVWPNRAACWSPSAEATGMPPRRSPSAPPLTSPYTSAEERISGSIGQRDADGLGDLRVPLHGVQVHQHGAGGVGHVGDVHAAVGTAGQVPDDPGVHGAEEDVAASARSRRPSTLSSSQRALGPAK